MKHHEGRGNTKGKRLPAAIQHTGIAVPAFIRVCHFGPAGFFVRTEYLHGAYFHADAAANASGLINQRGHKLAPLFAKALGFLWGREETRRIRPVKQALYQLIFHIYFTMLVYDTINNPHNCELF